MPVIQRFVAEIVGAEVSSGVDPMTAIAEGAAIASGILAGTINDVDFFVGTEHALGTIVHNDDVAKPEGEFAVLIRRNTKLPARASDIYGPVFDMQERVEINVIEGDPSLPITHEDNVVLKRSVELLEPRPKHEAGFSITYEYDVDGILHVQVVDAKTDTIMMDEELGFGATENRSQLPEMRRRVDGFMSGDSRTPQANLTAGLPAESLALVKRAREKDNSIRSRDRPEAH